MTAARSRSRLMLVALALVGCAAGGPGDAPADALGEACEVVYTPDAESTPYVLAAAARWSTATGCNIHVGPGGIPVVMAAILTNPEGKHP